MKKQSLLLGILVGGMFAMTSCSAVKTSDIAYVQQEEVAIATDSEVTENTAPVQTDNQAETQNQAAQTADVEETDSLATQAPAGENEKVVTEKQKASSVIIKVPVTNSGATPCPTIPAKTYGPVATKAPTVTKVPTVTKAPVVTKKPTATKAPVATKVPTVTKKPTTDSTGSGTSNSTYSQSVLNLINEQRKANGLSALTTTSALQNAATKRAKEMVTSFSHTRPDGTSGVTVLKEYGISYNAWGENIAYGQKTPAAVMDAWMNSSGHRANILSTKFGKVGIGCYQYNGVLYWTQVFTN